MKAIIFDLDGTMWDSTGESYKIWNHVFEEHPEIHIRLTQSDMSALAGKTMGEIAMILFPDMDERHRRRITDECGDEEIAYLRNHGAILYPGLRETIHVLKSEYELYIVSNCQNGYVESFLYAHHFQEDFKDIEMSGRTGKGKGENIRLLMSRNGVKEAVYVGDTEGDEKAAYFAGVPFIYAAYGFGKVDSPDRVIHNITELPSAIKGLGL